MSGQVGKEEPFGKKILVVDDDEHVQIMVQATLEAEGFMVKTARDGRQIVKLALEFKPDLIFTDLMMPGGGGYELLRTLQSDDVVRKIPVLLMSGHAWDKTTKDMMKSESNVVGFFDKPLRPASLLLKIHEILKTKSKEEKLIEERKREDDSMGKRKMDDFFNS